MQITNQITQVASSASAQMKCLALLLLALACLGASLVEAGGKGNMEDIIMYNGNIVMRGDKKGGSIVLANNHPHHEEVEYSPSFFYGGGHGHGDMGGHGGFRRR